MSWYYQSTDQYSQRIAYKAGTDFEEYIGETHPKDQHRTAVDLADKEDSL